MMGSESMRKILLVDDESALRFPISGFAFLGSLR